MPRARAALLAAFAVLLVACSHDGAHVGEVVLAPETLRSLNRGVFDLTSFTPEPIDGAWKFLRFTAPAAPENSGGRSSTPRGASSVSSCARANRRT
jgi:hypothetical protein